MQTKALHQIPGQALPAPVTLILTLESFEAVGLLDEHANTIAGPFRTHLEEQLSDVLAKHLEHPGYDIHSDILVFDPPRGEISYLPDGARISYPTSDLAMLADEFGVSLDALTAQANSLANASLRSHREIVDSIRSILLRLTSADPDISPDQLSKEIEDLGNQLGIDAVMMNHHVKVVREIFGPPNNRQLLRFLRNYLTPGAEFIRTGVAARQKAKDPDLTNHGNPIVSTAGPSDAANNNKETDKVARIKNHLVNLFWGQNFTSVEADALDRFLSDMRIQVELRTTPDTDHGQPTTDNRQPAPGKVRVTLDLSEEDAACIWHNHHYGSGPSPSLPEILTDKAKEEASSFKRAFPASIAPALAAFRQSQTSTSDH